jgi:hypothetical protein
VGHLFELVKMRLPDTTFSQGCATAMCFYRLRRALQTQTAETLKPKTSINALSSVPVRKLQQIIRNDCGLRPPPEFLSLWGCLALMLVVVFPGFLFYVDWPWWIALSSAGIGIVLYRLSPIRLPDEVKTFGDLVKIVTFRNIGALSRQGARLGSKEAWEAFRDIIGDHTELPKDQIAPETTIRTPDNSASD